MESKDIVITNLIVREIQLFKDKFSKAPSIVKMNAESKKQLTEERRFMTQSKNILTVDVILGLVVQIDESLYNNEVTLIDHHEKKTDN